MLKKTLLLFCMTYIGMNLVACNGTENNISYENSQEIQCEHEFEPIDYYVGSHDIVTLYCYKCDTEKTLDAETWVKGIIKRNRREAHNIQ